MANDALEKARELVEERRKAEFISSFEKDGRQRTDLLREDLKGGANFYYGKPVLQDGKLIGFDMVTYQKFYDGGRGFSGPDMPYKDENGKQIRFSVDEYLQFEQKLQTKDERLGVVIEKIQKENEIKEVQKKMVKQEKKPFNKLLGLFKKKDRTK